MSHSNSACWLCSANISLSLASLASLQVRDSNKSWWIVEVSLGRMGLMLYGGMWTMVVRIIVGNLGLRSRQYWEGPSAHHW